MALDPGTSGGQGPSVPTQSMASAMDQLALMKQARKDDREGLQEIAEGNVGTTAATILAFNQAKMADAVLGLDPNATVDTDDGEDEGDPASFTQPAAGSVS